MARMDDIRCRLPEGITVDTYSPGDGITRYRFIDNTAGEYYTYFSAPGHATIYTALGFKEAMVMAQGISAGNRLARG